MRILYGVAGEGMGHATRSHAFLADIVGDHEVLIVASGRAHDYLAQHFPEVREILGFSLAYEDNAIRRWETVAQNLRGAVSGWPAQVRSFYEIARDFEPDVVVSDFESFVLTVARRERVPAISVDNIMMLDRCRHDEGIIGGDTFDFEMARQIARTKAAGLHWAIVPTFFRPPLRRRATTLVAPVLREAVLAAAAEQGEHLLVYQTAAGSETLVAALHETGLPCRVYGGRRDLDDLHAAVTDILVALPFIAGTDAAGRAEMHLAHRRIELRPGRPGVEIVQVADIGKELLARRGNARRTPDAKARRPRGDIEHQRRQEQRDNDQHQLHHGGLPFPCVKFSESP